MATSAECVEAVALERVDAETEPEQLMASLGYHVDDDADGSAELQQEFLQAQLNAKAGVAFVDELTGIGSSKVRVTFRLPFGGEFTKRFARPNQSTSKYPDFDEFLAQHGYTIENMEDLLDERVEVIDMSETPVPRPPDQDWRLTHTHTEAVEEHANHYRQLRNARVGGLTLAVVGGVVLGAFSAMNPSVNGFWAGGGLILCGIILAGMALAPNSVIHENADTEVEWIAD